MVHALLVGVQNTMNMAPIYIYKLSYIWYLSLGVRGVFLVNGEGLVVV